MSDALQQWVDGVYNQVRSDISAALQNGTNETDLIIIGEQHSDDSYLSRIDPAIAASYVHISALEAARLQVGADNIVLSVELPEETLPQLISAIQANGGIPLNLADYPTIHAIDYALRQGIAIQASDPLAFDRNATPEAREAAMIESIASLASREDASGLVVHISGTTHLSGLMEVSETSRDPISERAGSRLESAFGDVFYYNTARAEAEELRSIQRAAVGGGRADLEYMLREEAFSTNPDNGITQFDAPEYADENHGNALRVINAARATMGMEPLQGTLSIEQRLEQQDECFRTNPRASEGACAHYFNGIESYEDPLPPLQAPRIIDRGSDLTP